MDMMVEKKCPFCGAESNIVVDSEAFKRWQNGALVQAAFKDLSSTEREILITGMCETCQIETFGDDNE